MHTKDHTSNQNNKTSGIADDLRNAKNKAEDIAQNVKEKGEDLFHHAVNEVKQKTKELQASGAEIQENVLTYVKKNPAKSVGFALFAGVLLAQLLRS
jgi:ElaB/YqjD/DUF883 family membrane-anchored ribosome-binding protein